MHYYEKGNLINFKKYRKIFGVVLIFLGILISIYFFFPVLAYQMFVANAYEGDSIEVPIPKYMVADKETGGIGSLIAQGINSLTTNYYDARNWYPQLPAGQEAPKDVAKYTLSIPKLKINNAEVSTKDYDLANHLVQYFGTAIPGQKGTSIIFGHSTIPAWFDPKNYKTIFATLHTIKVGDEIDVTVDGQNYKYKIFSIVITTPNDTNILSQSYDNSYITIVTCTPPGTIWKRLVVRAALQKDDSQI
ncbi:MAG TPA: sortase [Patescibacteria group bacterium]|nr:sortase [Patescibacteria group bacterium]